MINIFRKKESTKNEELEILKNDSSDNDCNMIEHELRSELVFREGYFILDLNDTCFKARRINKVEYRKNYNSHVLVVHYLPFCPDSGLCQIDYTNYSLFKKHYNILKTLMLVYI